MSKVKIQGHASGTGVLTVTAPNTSTDRTITLPDGTGTLLTTDGDGSSLTGVGVDGISSSATSTAITISSDENVGIGTTSPSAKLHLYEETSNTTTASNVMRLESRSSGTTGVGFGGTIYLLGERADGSLQGMAKISAVADINTTSDLSSALTFQTASSGTNTERLRIDSSGNVGIGVTPESWLASKTALQIGSTASISCYNTDNRAYFSNNVYDDNDYKRIATDYAAMFQMKDGAHIFSTAASGSADSTISWTNAMTIANDGHNTIYIPSGADCSTVKTGSTGSGNVGMIIFRDGNNDYCGQITSNPSTNSTSYVTGSDYRLKENVVPMTGSIDRLKQLNPTRFNFIKNKDITVDGFLAHEAQEVVPEAITGIKDAMTTEEYEVEPAIEATYDEEGNELTPAVEAVMGEREVIKPQGIDQSKLVPLLTSALQEAVAKIEDLEKRIEILEATV